MPATQAWVLRAGAQVGAAADAADALSLETFDLRPPAADEVLCEPILGSWEANIDHALARSPIDVCSTREEDSIVLGNLGVVRVLTAPADGGAAADGAAAIRPGDLCLLLPFGRVDRHGFAELVHAYDCPGTLGLLARRTTLPARLLLPIPPDSPYSPAQWATYGRYFTAWDNWRTALACWRSQLPDADPADHLVLGWGGGVSFAELTLARRAGFRVAMTAGSDERLAFLRAHGITAVDRRAFPALAAPPRRGAALDYHRRHEESHDLFRRVIEDLTGGEGAAIVVDNIGEPLQRATAAALAREGVIATCGWKAGMRVAHLRGAECIARHLHVHTHVWRLPDSAAIRDFQAQTGWIAPVDSTEVYDFHDVPRLARDYGAGRISSYFPLYAVNEL